MANRYVSGLNEEAMVLLGVDPAIYVNKAVTEKLEAEVQTRGFSDLAEFVEQMREIVRRGKLGATREQKAEAVT